MKKDIINAEIEYAVYALLPKDIQEAINMTLDNYEEKDYLSNIALEDRPFIVVKKLMEYVMKNDLEGFGVELGKMEEYGNARLIKSKTYEVLLSIRYLINHIVQLIEVENKMLSSKVPSKHDYSSYIEQVDFSVFPNYYSQLRSLAGNDILKFKEIEKLPYSDCFVELLYIAKDSDLEKLIMNSTTK